MESIRLTPHGVRSSRSPNAALSREERLDEPPHSRRMAWCHSTNKAAKRRLRHQPHLRPCKGESSIWTSYFLVPPKHLAVSTKLVIERPARAGSSNVSVGCRRSRCGRSTRLVGIALVRRAVCGGCRCRIGWCASRAACWCRRTTIGRSAAAPTLTMSGLHRGCGQYTQKTQSQGNIARVAHRDVLPREVDLTAE